MNAEIIFSFLIFCGFAGIFLRRNLLNIIVSFVQIICGINALFSYNNNSLITQRFTYHTLLFFTAVIILFIYIIIMLVIKRRSTLQVNELTEMRG